MTASLTNLPEKAEKAEEGSKRNSFLNLFSRKPTPSSLENLPLKSEDRRYNAHRSGRSTSFKKLSFRSMPSPSTPQSPVHCEPSMSEKDHPVDILVPLPEIESPTSERASQRTKQHGRESLSSPGTVNETWFETAATERELFGEVVRGDAMATTPTTTKGFPGRWESSASTAAFDRDLEQVSLDHLLVDFRSRKMRACPLTILRSSKSGGETGPLARVEGPLLVDGARCDGSN